MTNKVGSQALFENGPSEKILHSLYNEYTGRIELDLTDYCQLQCPGCPTPQGKTKLDRERILPFLENFEKYTGLEVNEVVICGNGGEPSLHPEITEFIIDALRIFKSAEVIVAHNGQSIKNYDLDKLTTLATSHDINKRLLFEWSIDGLNNYVHTQTRVGGNVDKVIDNLGVFQNYNLRNQILSTRHAGNEHLFEMVHGIFKEVYNLEVLFRDTTRVKGHLEPPKFRSPNGNISSLYWMKPRTKSQRDQIIKEFNVKPQKEFYINFNGDLFPCAAFYYNELDSELDIINIYDYTQVTDDGYGDATDLTLKPQIWTDYIKSAMVYCRWQRGCGDTRRCGLECGTDRDFEFDTIDDLRKAVSTRQH